MKYHSGDVEEYATCRDLFIGDDGMEMEMERGEEVLQQITEEGRELVSSLPAHLMRLFSVLVLIGLGVVVIRLGRRIVNRLYKHAQRGKEPTAHMRTAHTLLCSLLDVIMYAAIVISVLTTLGVNVDSLLTVAGIGGFAITFGCQTLIKDFISGIFLWLEGLINVGDTVTVAGQTGRVESMALRTTTLRGANGNLFTVPNGDIRTVVNMNRDFRVAIADVTIIHGQDYAAALHGIQHAMNELKEQMNLENIPQVAGITDMDPHVATIRITCRCMTHDCQKVEMAMRLAALEKMREIGIRA